MTAESPSGLGPQEDIAFALTVLREPFGGTKGQTTQGEEHEHPHAPDLVGVAGMLEHVRRVPAVFVTD